MQIHVTKIIHIYVSSIKLIIQFSKVFSNFYAMIQSIGDAAINSCKTRRVRDTNSNRRPTFVHVQSRGVGSFVSSERRKRKNIQNARKERHECSAKLTLPLVRSCVPRGILEVIHVNRVLAVKEGPFSG